MGGTERTAAGREAARFPELFAPGRWGSVSGTFRLIEAEPCDADVTNVTAVPYTARGWVVLVLGDGRPEVPGGTREPGESIEATLRRELLEEAGAILESFKPFGVWDCVSTAEAPYRPHLPHPRFQRLVGVGRVELVTTPTIGDGEDVVEVVTVSLEAAQARFRAIGRGDLADLYGLAAVMVGMER